MLCHKQNVRVEWTHGDLGGLEEGDTWEVLHLHVGNDVVLLYQNVLVADADVVEVVERVEGQHLLLVQQHLLDYGADLENLGHHEGPVLEVVHHDRVRCAAHHGCPDGAVLGGVVGGERLDGRAQILRAHQVVAAQLVGLIVS